MFNKNQNNCITDASRKGRSAAGGGAWHVCVDMALCMRPAYKSVFKERKGVPFFN